jgi:hypothetical protein
MTAEQRAEQIMVDTILRLDAGEKSGLHAAIVGQLVAHAREAEAAMRERCANVCDTLFFRDAQMDDCRSGDIAAAIRSLPLD